MILYDIRNNFPLILLFSNRLLNSKIKLEINLVTELTNIFLRKNHYKLHAFFKYNKLNKKLKLSNKPEKY